jgi:hypothetical protein
MKNLFSIRPTGLKELIKNKAAATKNYFRGKKNDALRPRGAPAAKIYDAFQEEAAKRKGRTPDEWQVAERQAVLLAATSVALEFDLPPPTLRLIMDAELDSVGSIDYAAKWAIKIVNAMKELPNDLEAF